MSLTIPEGDNSPPLKETIFQGKKIVITGGSSGIGLAIAQKFSSIGGEVTIIDSNAPDELPQNATFSQADVTNRSELSSVLSSEQIDILVISAGVTSETNKPTKEEVSLMESVNVDGVRNTLEVFGQKLFPNTQIIYIGTDDPPKKYYKDTKLRAAQLVRQYSDREESLDTRIINLGPVRTNLFLTGKTPETVDRIQSKGILYEPDEFAEDLIELLVEQPTNPGVLEYTMYKGDNN